MAGSENRVTIVIDGENDAGGAFAAATAEAEAFQKAMNDANQASFSASRAAVLGYDAQLRALRALRNATDEVKRGEEQMFAAQLRNANIITRTFRGILGGLSGAGGGLGGLFGNVGSLLGGIAGGAGIGVLVSGLVSLIADLASAGLGVISFGALAYPTFAKVAAAVGKTKDAMDGLSPAQRTIAEGAKSLVAEWDKMSKAFAPQLIPLMASGLKIAGNILRDITPFANAALKAIGPLLKQLATFTASPGFKQWLDTMLKETGPTITALAKGAGELINAFGKLMAVAASPNGLRLLNGVIHLTVGLIDGLAWAINRIGGNMKKWGDIAHQTASKFDEFRNDTAHYFDDVRHAIATAGHDIASTFDRMRHDVASWAHDIAAHFDSARHDVAILAHDYAHYFDEARHTVATWGHDIASTFDQVRHTFAVAGAWIAHFFTVDIPNWINNGIRFFQQLPGKIVAALASLPGMLFAAGQRAIQGLINGLGSMLGSLGSMAASIASKIAGFFGLSPAREGPLSGGGSPFIRGQHFGADFAAGMRSQTAMVGGAAAFLAGAAGPGGARAGAAAGGGGRMVLEVVPGGSALFEQFMAEFIRRYVRVRGGSVQTVFGRQ